MTSPQEALQKARELISDPKRWTQGAYAENANGFAEYPYSKDACKFCSVGAVANVLGIFGSDAEGHELVHLLNEAAPHGDIISLNDNGTHAEVLAAFDLAIARAPSSSEANP